MVAAPYQHLLTQVGFEMAAPTLRAFFAREGVTDEQAQVELAADVIQRTLGALQALARVRTVH
jgi:hypothetical protein